MKNIRLTQCEAVAALFFLVAVPGPARADRPQSHPIPTPNLASPGQQKIASPDDVFAGLGLSDAQKEEVRKIRQDSEARKAAVAKNQSLSQDQKDAMILGYTRLEYSQIFRALTAPQQKLVRERIRARQTEDAPTK